MKNTRLLAVLLSVLLVCLSWLYVENNKSAIMKCNDEQLNRVEKQYAVCTKTGYLDTYCYDQARFEHCDIISAGAKAN